MPALPRSRIAPTPSGYLHLGNAFNFLLTEYLTRRETGILRLRIDDLDAPRIRREYIADVFETLHWLGVATDEGPRDEADYAAHYSQQARLTKYDELLDGLATSGKMFACTCSRAEIQRGSTDGQYPGYCRDKALPLDTKNAAWRFRTEPGDVIAWQDAICGPLEVSLYGQARDFVIRRRDGLPAYHVASLCDDADYGINLIVRGVDLLESTAVQLHLAASLGITSFLNCRFYHHPLLQNEAGEKLSKSAGSSSLKALREAGMPGDELHLMAAEWYRSFLRV